MRKLVVRERLIAIGAKFDVKDENGEVIFFIEADKFDIGKNIHVYSNENKDIKYFNLDQVIRIGSHKYRCLDGDGRELGLIEKELWIPNYEMKGELGNFRIEGANMWGRAYEIKKDDILIGRFEKEFNFRDYYHLEVYDEEYIALIVSFTILIDMVRFHQ